jgi:hypothetical protein
MPFQEVVLGAVDPPAGQSDDLSRLGVELLAIAEVMLHSGQNTANLRIITWIDRCPAVVDYACPHFLEAIDTIGESVPLPGLGHAQRGKAIKEAATHDTVMRVVGLEEERLAHRRPAELGRRRGHPRAHRLGHARQVRNA